MTAAKDTEEKRPTDWERIEAAYATELSVPMQHGVESDIVRTFRESAERGYYDPLLPMTPQDSIAYELPLRFGRADIVVFHVDGSASVIEVKDGARGYNHVVCGIGQAALYAVQIAQKGAIKRVRKCLLWTSTGDLLLDVVIQIACEQADTIPLPWQSTASLLAMRRAVASVLGGAHGRA